jgi:hypothetical protein
MKAWYYEPMKKAGMIFLNALPILVMIALIPVVSNDYYLTLFYVVIIAISFALKRERNDFMILVFGFFIMIVSEYLFVSTGVETFKRNTLFGLMPLWLPFLWAYGFVAIKRSVEILGVK